MIPQVQQLKLIYCWVHMNQLKLQGLHKTWMAPKLNKTIGEQDSCLLDVGISVSEVEAQSQVVLQLLIHDYLTISITDLWPINSQLMHLPGCYYPPITMKNSI